MITNLNLGITATGLHEKWIEQRYDSNGVATTSRQPPNSCPTTCQHEFGRQRRDLRRRNDRGDNIHTIKDRRLKSHCPKLSNEVQGLQEISGRDQKGTQR